jgi:hypothetical protein
MNETRRSRWESPWVWIGIGCVVLFVTVGSFFGLFYLSFRQVRQRYRAAPIVAVAEAMAKQSQSLAVVSRDSRTVTLRNPKTGEHFILGQDGRTDLRIETEAGQVVVPFIGRGGILGRGRGTRLLLGSGAGPPPPWVPSLPGAKIRPVYAFKGTWGASGHFALDSSIPVPEVVTAFDQQLRREGFRLETEEIDASQGAVCRGVASSPDGRTVSIVGIPHSQPEILVSYTEGGAAPPP